MDEIYGCVNGLHTKCTTLQKEVDELKKTLHKYDENIEKANETYGYVKEEMRKEYVFGSIPNQGRLM